MTWMLLAILAMGAFANIMRYAQKRETSMVWAGTACYLTAAAACGCGWGLNREAALGWREVLFGTGSGATILMGYFLFSDCIRQAGVGVAQVFERLSMLVAAGISILLWKNAPTLPLMLGLLLAIVSIPLVSQGSTVVQVSAPRRKVAKLLMLLVITGVGSAILEAYRRSTPENTMPLFLFCQYLAIALGCLSVGIWKRGRPSRRDILFGIALGFANILFYYSCLRSLAPGRPGSVVFPTIAVGTILASTGGAAMLWGERYRRRTLIGMGLAVIALVLINVM